MPSPSFAAAVALPAALPTRCFAAAAMPAALLRQGVRCAAAGLERGMASKNDEGFNHSPPSPPRQPMPCLTLHQLRTSRCTTRTGSASTWALALIGAGKASERTKARIGASTSGQFLPVATCKASERTKPRYSDGIARSFGASARAWASTLRCCGQSERTNIGWQRGASSFVRGRITSAQAQA